MTRQKFQMSDSSHCTRVALIAAAAALALLTGAARGWAQSAFAFRDSVAALTDAREVRRIETARARREVADYAAAGFAAMRLYELTGDRFALRRARAHFDRLASANPGSGWGHYGHALTLLPTVDTAWANGEGVFLMNLERDLGVDYLSRARRAAERAARVEPGLPGLLPLLVRLSRITDDRDGLVLAREALAERRASGRLAAAELAALGEAHRALGEWDSMAALLLPAAEEPDATAAVLREAAIAAALRPGGTAEAARLYRRALLQMTDEDAPLFYQDLSSVAREIERERWHALEPAERRTWLHNFWTSRAALEGREFDERLVEQIRRVAFAETYYRKRRNQLPLPWLLALEWSEKLERYDARGLLYVRHGAPFDSVVTYIRDTSFLTWVYPDLRGGWVLYHMAGPPAGPYGMLQRVPCGADFIQLRVRYQPELSRLLSEQCRQADARELARQNYNRVAAALDSDTHTRFFETPLPFHYEVHAFRAPGGGTELVASAGIPVATMAKLGATSGNLPLRLQFTFVDTVSYEVNRAAQVYTVPAAAPGGDGALVVGSVTTGVRGGAAGQYRVFVDDAAGDRYGQGYGAPLTVQDFRGDALMLSDVMIATDAPRGTFRRGDVELTLNPSQSFAEPRFRLFYEVYNLGADSTFTTRIEVEPAETGLLDAVRRIFRGRPPVRLEFATPLADPSTAETLQQIRDVEAPLPSGRWTLRVTITTPSGRTATRERKFTVNGTD